MKELKSYTSKYDLKRTSAFFGPYRASRSERWASPIFAIVIGLSLAFILFMELSK